MRLLIVTQTLDSDDPILGFFHRWVEEFAKRFTHVTVVALNVGAHSLPANVSVHTLGKELGLERFPRTLRYIGLLFRLRNEYTHVFAHMNPEYVIGGGWLWRFLGKKIGFWYVHGTVSNRLKLAAFFAHRIFTASRESCRIDNPKVTIVGHGIDTGLFSPKGNPQRPALITTGRISPSKHLEVVIDAFSRLKSMSPSATFVIAGGAGSPQEEQYADTVGAAAKAAGVRVIPPVPHREIPALLKDASVFISASETGSLDKAVLEAMSAGVVPITSNPAYAPMLAPLSLHVARTPEAFAAKCLELFSNQARLARLSQTVRDEIVRHHSMPRLMDVLKNAYEKL